MINAYDHSTNERLSDTIVNNNLLESEKQIAEAFIKNNYETIKLEVCPICGDDKINHFAYISNIEYRYCINCRSIFTDISECLASSYQKSDKLQTFRRSKDFQETTSKIREYIWEELLFWFEYRFAHYFGTGKTLRVLDYENIFSGLSDKIKSSKFCLEYSRLSKVLGNINIRDGKFDAIIYMDRMRCEPNPKKLFNEFYNMLDKNGLLILSTRVGSGFDILTLKGLIKNVYPYEYAVLPSLEGLKFLLEYNGFEISEISTPGSLDTVYVRESIQDIKDIGMFLDYLITHCEENVLVDFQYFLQKHNLSSNARIIAKKK